VRVTPARGDHQARELPVASTPKVPLRHFRGGPQEITIREHPILSTLIHSGDLPPRIPIKELIQTIRLSRRFADLQDGVVLKDTVEDIVKRPAGNCTSRLSERAEAGR
jgi:hypothetical protein